MSDLFTYVIYAVIAIFAAGFIVYFAVAIWWTITDRFINDDDSDYYDEGPW